MRRLACLVVWLVGIGVAAAQPVVPPSTTDEMPRGGHGERLGQSPPAPASTVRPSRPSRRWTASIVTGAPSMAPLRDMERAMRDAGFDGVPQLCFGTCASYPYSVHARAYRDTWTATLNRGIGPRLGVSLTGGRTLIGWTTGLARGTSGFLEVEAVMSHVVPAATFTPAPGLRLSAGPGIFTTTYTGNGAGLVQSPLGTRRRPGLLAEASLTFPRRARVFAELSAQERWLGRQSLGPFDVMPGGPVTFPKTPVSVSHWFIGLGFGVRF